MSQFQGLSARVIRSCLGVAHSSPVSRAAPRLSTSCPPAPSSMTSFGQCLEVGVGMCLLCLPGGSTGAEGGLPRAHDAL